MVRSSFLCSLQVILSDRDRRLCPTTWNERFDQFRRSKGGPAEIDNRPVFCQSHSSRGLRPIT